MNINIYILKIHYQMWKEGGFHLKVSSNVLCDKYGSPVAQRYHRGEEYYVAKNNLTKWCILKRLKGRGVYVLMET